MPRQIERQLHARRKFREAFVDAELEDRRRDPDAAARSPAATGVAPARSVTISHWPVSASAGAARRMKAASPSSWISAVPRLPFQPLASSARNISSAARRHRACARPRNATAPCSASRWRWRRSSFSFLAPSASCSNVVGIARRIEAGAQVRLQHARTQAVAPQHARAKAFIAAPSSDTSRRTSACAPASRACSHQARRGVLGARRDRAAACTACRRDGR